MIQVIAEHMRAHAAQRRPSAGIDRVAQSRKCHDLWSQDNKETWHAKDQGDETPTFGTRGGEAPLPAHVELGIRADIDIRDRQGTRKAQPIDPMTQEAVSGTADP